MPGGYEWLIIIAVLLLLFGAKKLPEMARSVGQSARVFKGEMKAMKEDGAAETPADGSASTQTGTAASSAPERPADQDTPPRAS